MSYAITVTGWRAMPQNATEADLVEGETLVSQIPGSLLATVTANSESVVKTHELNELMSAAEIVIRPLQAGVDIDEISDEDRSKWKTWKRYLIALSQVPKQEGWPLNPPWPPIPE